MAARLIVVGTGIQGAAQISPLALAHVRDAEKLVFLSADPLTSGWLSEINGTAESLQRFYALGKLRWQTYEEIIDYVLSLLHAGLEVCFAMYGHPGVYTYPTHQAIRRARDEGFDAVMFPAISAEDCLFADLGVDPGDCGCQSYEATDFLVFDRVIDTTSALILWQVGIVGSFRSVQRTSDAALSVLVETLIDRYGRDHSVVLYEASRHPLVMPIVQRLSLGELSTANVTPMSTMYIPPMREREPNVAMIRRLGLMQDIVKLRE